MRITGYSPQAVRQFMQGEGAYNWMEFESKTVGKSEGNDYIIEKGTINDIDELEILYDNLNDYLTLGINYPGWAKGLYPISIHNTPAISLYEKCGHKYVGTVDLGLNIPELVWFKLYEIVF